MHILEDFVAHEGAGDRGVNIDHAAVWCQYIVRRIVEEMG